MPETAYKGSYELEFERPLIQLERQIVELESHAGEQGVDIAPDLRKLDSDCATLKDAARKSACIKEIDGYFLTTVRAGRTRNGAVYMPPFEGTFSQEAMWAIKAYLETRREKPL